MFSATGSQDCGLALVKVLNTLRSLSIINQVGHRPTPFSLPLPPRATDARLTVPLLESLTFYFDGKKLLSLSSRTN